MLEKGPITMIPYHTEPKSESADSCSLEEPFSLKLRLFDESSLLTEPVSAQRTKVPDINQTHIECIETGTTLLIETLLKEKGPGILEYRSPDSNLTILHYAATAGNIAAVALLLDYKKLIIIFEQQILNEADFIDFINTQSFKGITALGSVVVKDTKGDPKANLQKEEQISLFIKCPQFNINEFIAPSIGTIIHYLVQHQYRNLLALAATRVEANFDLLDNLGNTPLRIACINKDPITVSLLAKIQLSGYSIDLHNVGDAPRALQYLSKFSEKNWFGENISVYVEDGHKKRYLTAIDLLGVFEFNKKLNVQIAYKKTVVDLKVEFKGMINPTLKKQISDILKYKAEYIKNANIPCINPPECPADLPSAIRLYDYSKLFQDSRWTEKGLIEISDLLPANHEIPVLDISTLHSTPVNISVSLIGERKEYVLEPGTITHKDLLISNEIILTQEELLARDYTPIPYLVFINNDLETFKALLRFSNFDPTILVRHQNSLVSLGTILEGGFAEAINKLNLPVESIEDSTIRREDITPLLKFKNLLANRIARNNLIRINHSIPDVCARRLDSLARLSEYGSICMAVCFDGKNIIFSANTIKNTTNIDKVCNYFSDYVQGKDTNIAGLVYSITSKLLGKISKETSNNLTALITCLDNNIKHLPTLEFQGSLLTDASFKDVLTAQDPPINNLLNQLIPNFETNNEKAKQKANTLITNIIRTIIDIRKIENSLTTSDPHKRFPENLITAFTEKNIQIIGIGDSTEVHAEMRIIDLLLTTATSSLREKYYIGISKLCCSTCNFIIQCLGSFAHDASRPSFDTRGAHAIHYPWPVPNFLKDQAIRSSIFACDQEFLAAYEECEAIEKDSATIAFQDALKFEAPKLRILLPDWSVSRLGIATTLETISKA